ncbi:MAG: crtM 1 [Myxococcales bacterium]|nr:crtM 1 [Myxococcales bacterium]
MPDVSFIENAAAYCKKLTTRSKSNFYYAFLFLPRERREALEAVYAYCRLVDDVVDEEVPAAKKLEGIAHWRQELEAVYGDATPTHPVSQRLRAAVERFGIRREDMEAVIDGCAMDIDKTRYETWDELRLYCYRVASAVGLMCIEIFGYTPSQQEAVRRYAVDLGIALQLTNILRDVAEDAKRGRIYLPADELESYGVSDADLTSGRRSPQFVRMMQYQAGRARSHYLRARASLSSYERSKLVIAEIMGDIYYALLERIEARDFDVFGPKTTVSRRDKMRIALGNFARAQIHQLIARA